MDLSAEPVIDRDAGYWINKGFCRFYNYKMMKGEKWA
jgi:hypothetical protein